MLKSKSIFFILFFLPFLADAQGFEASVQVGSNFTQIDGDGLAGYNKLGLHTGIRIDRKWKGDWSWGFELNYSMKGSREVANPDDPTFAAVSMEHHYLEVPFLALYRIGDKIEVYAGPSLGLVVYDQREENGLKGKTTDLLPAEVAFHMGGSYAFSGPWQVQLRHSYSLASVRDQGFIYNNILQFGFAGWYHNVVTLSLVYDLGQ